MTLYWWRCEWCRATTPSRHDLSQAEADRDQHIATEHQSVVVFGAALAAITAYPFLEVHP